MDRRTFLTLTLAAPALVRDLRVPLEAAPPQGFPGPSGEDLTGTPDRSQRPEGYMAGEWAAGDLETSRSEKATPRQPSRMAGCTRHTGSRARKS